MFKTMYQTTTVYENIQLCYLMIIVECKKIRQIDYTIVWCQRYKIGRSCAIGIIVSQIYIILSKEFASEFPNRKAIQNSNYNCSRVYDLSKSVYIILFQLKIQVLKKSVIFYFHFF